MSTLIIFCYPEGGRLGKWDNPQVEAAFRAELEKAGPFDWHLVDPSGLSSAMKAASYNYKRDGDGRMMPAIMMKTAGSYDRVAVISWSAGYGFVRELLANEGDREAVDAVILLDGLHSSKQINDEGMEPFRAYAARAKAGDACLAVLHTDIRTPYASTTETAGWLAKKVGVGGRFSIHHVPGADKKAHVDALNVAGPELVRDVLVPYLIELSGRPSSSGSRGPGGNFEEATTDAWRDPSISHAERCLALSFDELKRGTLEVPPGSNSGPRIAEYFTGITRLIGGREQLLGIKSGNWCAAGATWVEDQCALTDAEKAITIRRASGIEMQRDAAAAGLWRPKEWAASGRFKVQPGDYAIFNRGRTTGPTAWQRHVARVSSVGQVGYTTVDANSGDRWRETRRALDAPELLGFIELPDFAQEIRLKDQETAKGEELYWSALGPLLDVSARSLNEDPMDVVQRLLDEAHERGRLTSG